jgi:hypothetical protein
MPKDRCVPITTDLVGGALAHETVLAFKAQPRVRLDDCRELGRELQTRRVAAVPALGARDELFREMILRGMAFAVTACLYHLEGISHLRPLMSNGSARRSSKPSRHIGHSNLIPSPCSMLYAPPLAAHQGDEPQGTTASLSPTRSRPHTLLARAVPRQKSQSSRGFTGSTGPGAAWLGVCFTACPACMGNRGELTAKNKQHGNEIYDL